MEVLLNSKQIFSIYCSGIQFLFTSALLQASAVHHGAPAPPPVRVAARVRPSHDTRVAGLLRATAVGEAIPALGRVSRPAALRHNGL